jgi:hypothetical protein
MNLFVSLKKYCREIEYTQRSTLNEYNPLRNKKYPFAIDPSTLSIRMQLNYVILFDEISCRSFLLIARSVKTVHALMLGVLSPFSWLLREKLVPPNLAWKRFCREVRYLGAESFEFIGVVVCSILLLPFNRQHSHRIINVQIWVERTAEWISGQKIIRETLDSANEKKNLLVQARNVIKISEEEIDKWVDMDIGEIYELTIDFDSSRRIFLNPYKCEDIFLLKQKANKWFTDLGSIISDRIVTVAIPRQQQILACLKGLFAFPEYRVPSNCDISDPLEKKLLLFQQITSEIEKTIEQLHEIHDPTHIVKNALENLQKEKKRIFTQAEDAAFKNIFSIEKRLEWYKVFAPYFFNSVKKLAEIEYIYSYKNIIHSNEIFSKNFASDLVEQISECQKLLRDEYITWQARGVNKIHLDRQGALKILDLIDTATDVDIRKAYKRLSLIHHPDKGGDAQTFNIIKNAYDLIK